MATEAPQLTGKLRTAPAGAVRAAGGVPAVLYGHGIENLTIQVDGRQFGKTFSAVGYTTLLNLSLENGKAHNVLVRDVQFHPLNGTVTHIDFYQVRLDEVVRADVPLNFTGVSPAVKDLGGVLVRNLDTIEVEALPQHLPHDITVDIAALSNFDAVIHVADLPLPEGVTVLSEGDEVVALVQAPRTTEELDSLAEQVTEDVAAVEGVAPKEAPAEGEADAEKKSEA